MFYFYRSTQPIKPLFHFNSIVVLDQDVPDNKEAELSIQKDMFLSQLGGRLNLNRVSSLLLQQPDSYVAQRLSDCDYYNLEEDSQKYQSSSYMSEVRIQSLRKDKQ